MSARFSILRCKILLIEYLSRLGIITKKKQIYPENLPVIQLPSKNGIANYTTSGNVYKVIIDGDNYYFRICRKHEDLIDFVHSLVNDYIYQRGVTFLEGLKGLLENETTLTKFAKMGFISDSSSGVYKYFRTGDVSYLGLLHGVIDESDRKEFDVFVNYIWSELHSYDINRRSGNYHVFNYNRGKSQEILYSLLGINNLICSVNLVVLKGQRKWVGTLMPEALGLNPKQIKKGEIEKILSPVIVKDLTTMNMMDVLCYEGDHRPGNYMIVLNDSGMGVSIQAFDNDSSLDFFPLPFVSKRVCDSEPFIKKGRINRAHMDRSFVNNFISTDNEVIVSSLKYYLTGIQLHFLKIRLKKIKKALYKTTEERPGFLLDSHEWNTKTLEEDLSYGTTYYSILRDWYEGDKDPVLLQQEKQPLCTVNF